jgi:UDP-N-acetylmuramoyl-tripeptide--D-alanyl-D-alanine ligase
MSGLTELPRRLWRYIDRFATRQIIRLRWHHARQARRRFVGTYVAVTGSCGKSTATMLTQRLLSLFGSTSHIPEDNSRGHVVRTLRKITRRTDYVMQEVSGHAPGAIRKALGDIEVSVGIVTAVGLDHASSYRYEGMEVIDAVAAEKGVLAELVAPGGLVCLNADDPRVRAMAPRAAARVVLYGTAADAEVRASNVSAVWPARLSFDLSAGSRSYQVQTRFVGTLLLPSILAAIAVVHGLGHDVERAVEALGGIEPVHNKMGVRQGADGRTYIDDSQKAPHWSVERLIEELPAWGMQDMIFVLGDMSDMRTDNNKKYRRVLQRLAGIVREVVATGQAARQVPALLAAGVTNVVAAPAVPDVTAYLRTRPPGPVFLKANRPLQLWRVIDNAQPPDGNSDVPLS